LAKHGCVENGDLLQRFHNASLVNRLSVDEEVALDLGCKLCARVYLAIFRNNRVSWLEQIMRDARMSQRTVKRHLNRLLMLKLVKERVLPVYEIVREIDSLKEAESG